MLVKRMQPDKVQGEEKPQKTLEETFTLKIWGSCAQKAHRCSNLMAHKGEWEGCCLKQHHFSCTLYWEDFCSFCCFSQLKDALELTESLWNEN